MDSDGILEKVEWVQTRHKPLQLDIKQGKLTQPSGGFAESCTLKGLLKYLNKLKRYVLKCTSMG